ncbi:MAG TPA: ABC transporter substrate-binding protein [Xanthobacteraceae bacterium]
MSCKIARRKFIAALGGAAAFWSRAVRAQQQALPVVGFVNGRSADSSAQYLAAFRQGLKEAGYVEGQNVTVEYHWLEGQYGRLPGLMADLVRRQVAAIATPGSNPAALAAKAATGSIPIVFGVGQDPVRLGLVASLARPGSNATGANFFGQEVGAKGLQLLHELVPKAARIAVLANPANSSVSEVTIREVQEAAAAIGLTVEILKATTIGEIDAAFATFESEHLDALFVAPDGFFSSRCAQFATLTARDKIPATYWNRDFVAAGGLMSYGTDLADTYRQVGVYTGRVLKGAKPADLPVVQSTKFVFAINLQTARALGIEVSQGVLSIADEVIE